MVLVSNSQAFQSRIEEYAKVGNHRHISRSSLLLPLYSFNNSLVYFNGIAMFDSVAAKELNAGIGVRHLGKEEIWGVFLHFDRRESKYVKYYHQITLGLEYFSSLLEFRLNGYMPLSDKHKLSLHERDGEIRLFGDGRASIERHSTSLHDRALSGLDVELGLRVLSSPLTLYAGYYHFGFSGAKSVYGPRVRARLCISNNLSLSAELQRDIQRGLHGYLGLDIKLSLGKDTVKDIHSLSEKMVSMPIRDIDIITVEEQSSTVNRKYASYQLIEDADSLDLSLKSGQSNKILLISRDIDYNNTRIHAHAPLKGVHIIGISDGDVTKLSKLKSGKHYKLKVSEDSAKRIITGYIVTKSPGSYGFFSELQDSYLANLRFTGAILAATATSPVGGVVGKATSSSFYNIELSSVIVSNQANNKVGGIAGEIFKSTIKHSVNHTAITAMSSWASGGIVGAAYTNSVISDCTNHGKVIGTKSLGGIAGELVNSTIKSSTNKAEIGKDDSGIAGGIVGGAQKKSLIEASNNFGKVIGKKMLGGIVGLIENSEVKNSSNKGVIGSDKSGIVGGISGFAIEESKLHENSNSGKVLGEKLIAGIAGYIETSSITKSHNTGDIIGNRKAGGIVGAAMIANHISDNQSNCLITADKCIGGVVGWCEFNNRITSNEIYGKIEGRSYIGGMLGHEGLINTKENNKVTLEISGLSHIGEISGKSFFGKLDGLDSSESNELKVTLPSNIENLADIQQDIIDDSYESEEYDYSSKPYDPKESEVIDEVMQDDESTSYRERFGNSDKRRHVLGFLKENGYEKIRDAKGERGKGSHTVYQKIAKTKEGTKYRHLITVPHDKYIATGTRLNIIKSIEESRDIIQEDEIR
jgi:hypothetical protein